jgi:Domain of unknown function (DUF4148)
MFKSLMPAVVVVAALVAPTFAFAQDAGPITRAQVKAELVRLEKSGYKPDGDHATYPAMTQVAEQGAQGQGSVAATSYGSASGGTTVSGALAPAPARNPGSTYFGQ